MIFKTRTATIAKIHFAPTKLTYSGPVDMVEFSLANYTVSSGIDGKKTNSNIVVKNTTIKEYYIHSSFPTIVLIDLNYLNLIRLRNLLWK